MIKSAPKNKGLIYHDEDLPFRGGDNRCFAYKAFTHHGMGLIKRRLGQITEQNPR